MAKNDQMYLNNQLQQAKQAIDANNISLAYSILNPLAKEHQESAECLELLMIINKAMGNINGYHTTAEQLYNLNPNNSMYQGELGIALKQLNQPSLAREKLAAAIQNNNSNVDVIKAFALVELSLKNFDSAQFIFENYLDEIPHDSDAHNDLGVVLVNKGNYEEALISFQEAIKYNPKHVDAHNNLGNCYLRIMMATQAISYFEEGLKLDPNHVQMLINNGKAHFFLGNNQQAESNLLSAIQNSTNGIKDINALDNLAQIYKEDGRVKEAIEIYQQIINLEPRAYEVYSHIGLCYFNIEKYEQAIYNFAKCLSYQHNDPELYFMIANCYRHLNNIHKAIECYQNTLVFKDDHQSALENLANLYLTINDYNSARLIVNRILEITPNSIFALVKLSYLNIIECNWSNNKFAEIIINAFSNNEQEIKNVSPFEISINNKLSNLEESCYKYHSEQLQSWYPATEINIGDKKNKINIGYLLPSFDNHASGLCLKSIVPCHSHDLFNVKIFTTANLGAETKQIYSDYLIDCSNFTIQQTSNIIKKHEIDILIDLVGYADNNYPSIISNRPAPIQCHFLGSTKSLKGDFIDYHITSQQLLTEENTKSYSENLCILNNLPYTLNLNLFSNKHLDIVNKEEFIYANLANYCHINQDIFDAWIQILAATPKSKLLLLSPTENIKNNLINYIKDNGKIDEDRIIFDEDSYITDDWRHEAVDLYLDTIHTSSPLATCLMIAANVPCLTIAGKNPEQRFTSSIMNQLNLNQYVTDDLTKYIEQAIYLYNNPLIISQDKFTINSDKEQLSIFNSEKLVNELEISYTKMYNLYFAEGMKSFKVA